MQIPGTGSEFHLDNLPHLWHFEKCYRSAAVDIERDVMVTDVLCVYVVKQSWPLWAVVVPK